jgi:NMD protein affecting ribosome stability and mRNA decay
MFNVKKVCPKCGKKGDFDSAFCADCEETLESKFRTRNKKEKPLPQCPKCGNVRDAGKWVNKTPSRETVKELCPECRLQSGGYHEAVIQFRGPREKAVRLAQKAVKKIGAKTGITSLKEDKHGADVLVVRKRPAIEFVQSLGKDFKQTRKLVTQTRDGKRVYRTTLCVRLE